MANSEGSAVVKIGAARLDPVPEIIDAARTLLERAESGELRGIAYVTLLTDSVSGYGVLGPEARGGYLRVAGLLLWLANRCTSRWEELSPELEPELDPKDGI